MKNDYYEYVKQDNVVDFLQSWEKANTVAFSTKALTKDFNQVCATEATENQMSNILAALTKKGILRRRGRGIYALVEEGFKNREEKKIESSTETSYAIPTVDTREKIESSTETSYAIPTVDTREKIESSTETSYAIPTVDTREKIESNKLVGQERYFVEKFIKKHSISSQDFVFKIQDVANEYPEINRTKLGNAIKNMYYTGKLKKGEFRGEYISPKPNGEYLSPKPNGEYISPKPNGEYISPKPNGEYISPKPNGEYISPKPNGEYLSLKPDEIINSICAICTMFQGNKITPHQALNMIINKMEEEELIDITQIN